MVAYRFPAPEVVGSSPIWDDIFLFIKFFHSKFKIFELHQRQIILARKNKNLAHTYIVS